MKNKSKNKLSVSRLLPSKYNKIQKTPMLAVIALVAVGLGSAIYLKGQAATCTGVSVSPGANIQGLIDANGTGTTFCFNSGTYSILTALRPKTGNKFIAVTPRAAILNGNNAEIMAINNEGASNVEIKGLVIEKFLTTRQGGMGAIKGGHYWTLDNNEFRYNNSDVYIESNGVMTNGYHHHSWAVGGGGYKGTNFRFENNEVAYMNPNGYGDSVTKWTAVNGLVIRGNYSHDNPGSGLWVDGDNINVVIENNRVENNALDGIHYEISCGGVVRNNTITNSGRHGIAVVASQDVEVVDNHITGSKQGAVVIWHQNRGSGTNCQWTVSNNQIHYNVMQNDEGFMGVRVYQALDGDAIYDKNDGRVRFYNNTYYNNIDRPFYWMNNIQTKEIWQGSYGQDLDSTFLSGQAPSSEGPPNPTTSNFGDVTGDKVVNGLDLSKVLTNYNKTAAIRTDGDLNGDGSVNGLDLSQVLTNYGKTYSSSDPIWSDEFDAPLDMTTSTHVGKWRPNDFWQNINRGYRDFAGTSWNLNPNEHPGYSPFSVNNGVLAIKAIRTPAELHDSIAASMAAQGQTGSVPAWSGGMLITNPAEQKFKYGYFEFKARWPNNGKGMFPALWLYGTDGSGDTLNKGSAEIDIFEIFGHATGKPWESTLHYRNNSGTEARPKVSLPAQNTDTAAWHTYSLDWQPTYLRFYKDDVLVHEVTGENASWFNSTMGIRMNYAMDANWFAPAQTSDSTTLEPLQMEIDYIRVYATKP